MDLSDIIYIICLALGIFGSIGQYKDKKKANQKEQRKQQQQSVDEDCTSSSRDVFADDEDEYYDEDTSTESQAVPSLDDIFRALREGRPLEKPAPKPIPLTTPLPSPYIVPGVEDKDSHAASHILPEEGIKAVSSEMTSNEISDSGVYDDETDVAVYDRENIDWRQAVVTNEILNRKY